MGAFASEVLGTAMLILLGAGVCAAVTLPNSAARNTDWLTIAFGWGFAVFAAVYVSGPSGAHLNPAVSIGQLVAGNDFAPGIAPTFTNFLIYVVAQLIGAFIGAWVAYLAYKKHFDIAEPGTTKGIFSTGPAVRSYGWNFVSEAIGTFVLVGFVVASGQTPSGLGPLAVALIVVAIGLSLGTPTGYAINPARDLGPRIAHALMPIKGKPSSDWAYAWVPIAGPLVGATLAALIVPAVLAI
ncbi:aquaporin family protein [Corynebacterium sp. 153RC1]|nr:MULTISPECIES: MIP/aquaporin family protein [unclassified Corynebacterium]MCQ9370554.1 aquaporin family protein [Corynebacterium sp. 35RC1]MCQ9352930.1 aquaporin family protein [Corynebacterium sp. 209RC1]MCQ9353850.1 aquaporin family protein [Corynebacterium sp. 1222RC1]MCQ9356881.1 aquaporin family protein [Corynebacterium sp. 122RC1]MCQ9358268.1 aquaporin family protein [Corynebacterium sp. 142RC1]